LRYYLIKRTFAPTKQQWVIRMQAISSPPITQAPLTTSHAAAGMEWLYEMSKPKKWNLAPEEITDLLGGIPTRTYHDLKRKALAGQRAFLKLCK
jgi:hypothetical protein